MRKLWKVRELSTVAILALEIAFFAWYLWPDSGRSHPFLNAANGLTGFTDQHCALPGFAQNLGAVATANDAGAVSAPVITSGAPRSSGTSR